MRIIAPLIFAILGALIGLGVNKLMKSRYMAAQTAALIGAAGAFAGLIIRDYNDWAITTDALVDTLIGAACGALAFSLIASLYFALRR